jgi:hypothetical protein
VSTGQTVFDALQLVTFGSLSEYNRLGLLPLLAREDRAAGYATLDEAMAKGSIRITEITEVGHVPELKVENSGDAEVLIVDGEELVGAKQNRVVNLTLVIPAHKTMVIPVSCVESGRWRHTSRAFAAAPRVQFAEGRAAKMQNVTESLLRHNSRRSDQGEVWNIIAEKSARLDAPSPTSAMSSLFEAHEEPIDDFVKAFTPAEHQVGAVFFVNGRVAGLELFDSAATWRKIAPKLTRSYAVDAIDRRREDAGHATPDAARAFCGEVASSPASSFQATGEGEDVRLAGVNVMGAALVVAGRTVHLSAFPTNGR